MPTSSSVSPAARRPKTTSRYESQKRRDWATFTRYLSAHRPPLDLARCSGAHVLEFLRYLDRFGKTKVHAVSCPQQKQPDEPCRCPLRQAWGSLDALVGRLRAAYDESGENNNNPFAARAVRLYLRDVRDAQSVARGISYNRNKKKKKNTSCSKQASAPSSKNDAASLTELMHPPYPPPPPYFNGVPFECCDDFSGSVLQHPLPATAVQHVWGLASSCVFQSKLDPFLLLLPLAVLRMDG
ncbi:hypothetical protein PR202_ga28399 [Eleusine coracana subsp. coracana]|uniref:ALOG domain-containing protein n=1 Tax=Eleusine coracana subsp. coracana TaxID=191504 RepID=A0AAV5DK92_ELECO|nr:hypothetical protein PR202_ga28399 [Eleusine coracana subsp. coracana]